MNKIIILIFLFLISCSSITPKSKYNIDEVKGIATINIARKSRDLITKDRIRISKRGFGKWYILAYGNFNNYYLELDEDGKLLKYEIIKFE